MSAVFNPYHTWLGLDETINEPNFYQLFQIAPTESDPTAIAQAADRAIALVRGCRPGEHAAVWAQTIDLLNQAKATLMDPAQRGAYDQQLQQPTPPVTQPVTEQPAQPTSAASSDFLPPGMGGAPIAPTTPAANPTHVDGVPVLEEATPDPAPSARVAVPTQQPASYQPAAQVPQPAAPQYADLSGGMPTPTPAAVPQTAMPQAAVAQPVVPQAAVAQPVVAHQPGAVYPTPAPVQPVAQYQAPGMVDPMAPVGTAGQVAPQGYVPQAAPMAVAAPAAMPVDPMAPVGANPMAATPTAVDPMAPAGGAFDPNSGRMVADEPKPGVESKSTPTSMANQRRKSASQTPMMVAIGLALFGLFAGGVYLAMQMNGGDEVVDNGGSVDKPTPSNDKPTPNKKPKSNTTLENKNGLQPRAKTTVVNEPPKPNPAPTPSPTPPTPTPTPSPTPPTPTPTPPTPTPPTPTPTPPEPAPVPVVKPTAAEVAMLEKALETAKTALFEKNIDVAMAELQKAAPFAKLPAHKAKLERLQTVTKLLGQFWDAVVEGTTKLTGGDVIEYKGNSVAIVESSKELVIYRYAGTNFRRAPRKLGDGLAIVVAGQVLPKDDANTYLMHGALFAVNIDKNPDYEADARRLWQQASVAGADGAEDLLEFLTDDYKLMKDLEE